MDILIKRYPEEQLPETKISELVEIVTDPPNVAVDPMVKPTIVTLTYASATMSPDFKVITMRESVLGPEMADAVPLTDTLVGVTSEAKNPDGYDNVIVLEADSAPPALGVNPNVTGTPGLLTTRSLFAMLNATLVTAPPIQPEAVLSEETSS